MTNTLTREKIESKLASELEMADFAREIGRGISAARAELIEVYTLALKAPEFQPASAVVWNAANIIPLVEAGNYNEFVIAVYRKESDKVYTFSAYYLNAFPLSWDTEQWPTDNDGLALCSGWFEHSSNLEYDDLYTAMTFQNGDKLMGWCETPKWSSIQSPLSLRREASNTAKTARLVNYS